MGYIEPRNIAFRMENIAPITEMDAATGITTTFTLAVWDSIVSVECSVSEISREYISALYTRSYEHVRSAVDLVSFMHGWSLSVYIDQFIAEDGTEETLMLKQDRLDGICTAYSLDDIENMMVLIGSDTSIFAALNDLIMAVGAPRMAAINCARAIEGIRTVMTPAGMPRAKAWPFMREELNLDEAAVTRLTDLSQAPRHGNRSFIPSDITEEAIQLSWQIMNRFFIYLRRGCTRLPTDEFPLLS